MSYSGVWHKTVSETSDTALFQIGLPEADLPGVVAEQSGSLIDLDLTAAPAAGRHEGACRLGSASGGSRPQGETG